MNEFLFNKIEEEYNNEVLSLYQKALSSKRYTTIRINNLKAEVKEIKRILTANAINYQEVSWYPNALIILNKDKNALEELSIYKEGKIYLQSLSSQLPPLFLEPQPNELILDMAAAPGGKTSEICALTNNACLVTAIEKNKIRYERLKYNLDKLGTKKVNTLNIDARHLDDLFTFDKILLDAPCSGTGTLDNNTINNFNIDLLNRSINIQYNLLKTAIKHLKKNGLIIYSTCSILKEENENIINKILKENPDIILEPIHLTDKLPLLNNSLDGTITLYPNEYYEGFFIAKLKKIK